MNVKQECPCRRYRAVRHRSKVWWALDACEVGWCCSTDSRTVVGRVASSTKGAACPNSGSTRTDSQPDCCWVCTASSLCSRCPPPSARRDRRLRGLVRSPGLRSHRRYRSSCRLPQPPSHSPRRSCLRWPDHPMSDNWKIVPAVEKWYF